MVDGLTRPLFVPAEKRCMRLQIFIVISGFLMALPGVMVLSRSPAGAASIEVPRISIKQAKLMHDRPDVIFIDVRTAKSWWRSATKITRAVREELNAVKQWAPKYDKSNTLIFYCA